VDAMFAEQPQVLVRLLQVLYIVICSNLYSKFNHIVSGSFKTVLLGNFKSSRIVNINQATDIANMANVNAHPKTNVLSINSPIKSMVSIILY
jgi:hypothetical protein